MNCNETFFPRGVRFFSSFNGSRPTKPLEEAPFRKVHKIFSGKVQWLDSSGEVFRKETPISLLESLSSEKRQIDDHTVQIDLKKKTF